MRIDSSTIGMESVRRYSSTSERMRRMSIRSSRQGAEEGTNALFGNLLGTDVEGNAHTDQQAKEKESLEGSSAEDFIRTTMEEMRTKVRTLRTNSVADTEADAVGRQIAEIRQQCLDYLMQLFFPERTGKNHWQSTEYENGQNRSITTGQDMLASWKNAVAATNVTTFQYGFRSFYEETESTSFSTEGTVRCADGREINFNLNVEMSRSFQEYYEETLTMAQVNLCDPLVINLEGNVAELSDQTFFFDIDADGVEDQISRLIAGSGFLALDKDENGRIDDGSELFGTQSGNGFADLAAYDEDGNGFIDEGDAIWEKLRIWVMDENGNQQLYSLAEKGVGAIGLMNADTEFTLTGAGSRTDGVIRKTGFFLFENGNAGTVQHLDLAKHN